MLYTAPTVEEGSIWHVKKTNLWYLIIYCVVLRLTDCDYPFGIFVHFLSLFSLFLYLKYILFIWLLKNGHIIVYVYQIFHPDSSLSNDFESNWLTGRSSSFVDKPGFIDLFIKGYIYAWQLHDKLNMTH